jgi:hypothetical protein
MRFLRNNDSHLLSLLGLKSYVAAHKLCFVDSSSYLDKIRFGGRTMRESKFRKSQVQTLKQAGVERPRWIALTEELRLRLAPKDQRGLCSTLPRHRVSD